MIFFYFEYFTLHYKEMPLGSDIRVIPSYIGDTQVTYLIDGSRCPMRLPFPNGVKTAEWADILFLSASWAACKISFTDILCRKFARKSSLKIPSHLKPQAYRYTSKQHVIIIIIIISLFVQQSTISDNNKSIHLQQSWNRNDKANSTYSHPVCQ